MKINKKWGGAGSPRRSVRIRKSRGLPDEDNDDGNGDGNDGADNGNNDEEAPKSKTILTMKVYPTNYLNGNGFFYDNKYGTPYGDVRYVIDDRKSNLTDMDKTNYFVSNLFEYVKGMGSSNGSKPGHDINEYFKAGDLPKPLVMVYNVFDKTKEVTGGNKKTHPVIKKNKTRRIKHAKK